MKIQVEIDVFDDSELCDRSHLDNEKCSGLHWLNSYCYFFSKELDFNGKNCIKCEACKAAYKKAQEPK